MNDKINLYMLIFLIISGTLLSAVMVNFVIIQFGITNDYVFYNLQDITEDLADKISMMPNTTNITQAVAEGYQETITWLDNVWFLVYILFIILTMGLAYRIKQPTDISFLMTLLYGIFIFLFVGWLSQIFVDWFTTEVTLKMLPNALEFFPKYEWYLNNVGIINLVHAVVLLFISRVNFQLNLRNNINKQELSSLDSEEIN